MTPPPATAFTLDVIKMVKRIPRGRVATYGQIAGLVGRPWASRGVSMILHARGRVDALPWHWVLGAGGRIKFAPGTPEFRRQAARLRAEEVKVLGGVVDLLRYGWARKPITPKGPPRPTMFG